MSRVKAGFFLLLMVWCASAFGQVTGEVESVGFGNTFRPDCWTPMLVRIRPGSAESGTYQIQVVQEDLDRDRAIYTRTITLTGGARDQRFWCYFLPQPTKITLDQQTFMGLPETTQGGNLKNLQGVLKVFLCTANGKQITQLPITSSITGVEPGGNLMYKRGAKFILFVTDGQTQPMFREYNDPNTAGVVEEIQIVTVRPGELPENIIGYDSIDAIVWSSATPPDASIAADEPKARAIQQYVRAGGKLVILQPVEWQKALLWGDLLPVNFPKIGDNQGIARKDDLQPLTTLAQASGRFGDPWMQPKPPFAYGLAEAKPDAIVDETISWPKDSGLPEKTPWLVRRPYGCGETIWVAQDLGDTAINRSAKTGWAYVWDRVFDWRHDLHFYSTLSTEDDKHDYQPSPGVDFGASLLHEMELPSTIAWLIGVAVTFFIGYWLLAGPGTYFYLLKIKRVGMSWVGFAGAAVAATALTVLVVRLVLRGAPEMHHVTLLRVPPSGPVIAQTRMGLYIKRDAEVLMELKDTAPETVSFIAPYPLHPQHVGQDASEFAANLEYDVPVHDIGAAETASLRVPFRSTMKKLEVRWVGDMTPRVTGNLAIVDAPKHGNISGKLVNNSGKKLKNIYLAYNGPAFGETRDIIVYFPTWDDGATIDLTTQFPQLKVDAQPDNKFTGKPEDNTAVWGYLGVKSTELEWDRYWDEQQRKAMTVTSDGMWTDHSSVPIAFPQLSLFERLGPVKNSGGFHRDDRFERLRRGARRWDMSQSVAAGDLVVLAEVDDAPLPYMFEVDGDKIGGTGTIYYQYSIPVDRSAVAATTQPTARAEFKIQNSKFNVGYSYAGGM